MDVTEVRSFRGLFTAVREQNYFPTFGDVISHVSSTVMLGVPQVVIDRIKANPEPDKTFCDDLLTDADPVVAASAKAVVMLRELMDTLTVDNVVEKATSMCEHFQALAVMLHGEGAAKLLLHSAISVVAM